MSAAHPLRRRSARVGIAAAAVLVVGLAFGTGAVVRASAASQAPDASLPGSDASWWNGGPHSGWSGSGGDGGRGVTAATSAQETGVVDIDVVLNGTERAAGTGMVLTSTGEVLTNRHVVDGETSISVTVPATGRTYAARVVGISTTTDVAVVQLENVSGLATVKTSSDTVDVGDAVVGVGNAGGTGILTAAAGTVTALDRSITASDTDGSDPEQLTGLIEVDAAIQAGDSGGPLLDSSNEVVGMDTAASSQGHDAYAIPIATALAVAKQIEAGAAGTEAGAGGSTTSTSRGYLGVTVQDTAGGVQVGEVIPGSPAAAAGLAAGDTITSVAGHPVSGLEDLTSVMASLTPGQRVLVTWVDPDGNTHYAPIILAGLGDGVQG
jgi:S1-C subfamily serine protease